MNQSERTVVGDHVKVVSMVYGFIDGKVITRDAVAIGVELTNNVITIIQFKDICANMSADKRDLRVKEVIDELTNT